MNQYLLYLHILLLALAQTTSFSIFSRSRNRNHTGYQTIACIFSNGVWYFTFRALIKNEMALDLFIPYTTGCTLGSLWGVKISMTIEKWLEATADGHITNK